MNRGDIVSLLQSEAKRRPIVAELLARVTTLTDAEIDAAPVPMKWYRDALRVARDRRAIEDIKAALDAYAKLCPAEHIETSANLKNGITLEYTGENFWAIARRGFQIEVKTGDLFFFPEDGGAWLNQTFFDSPPTRLKDSRKIAEQTRYEYLIAYQKGLLSYPDISSTIIEDTPSMTARPAGMRFFKPG